MYSISAPLQMEQTVESIEVATSTPEVAVSVCESVYDYGCSCMNYLKTVKGLYTGGRNAEDLEPNSFTATVGDIALFKYPNISHAAYVEEVYVASFKVSEWNYKPGQETVRVIKNNDPALIGFIHQVSP